METDTPNAGQHTAPPAPDFNAAAAEAAVRNLIHKAGNASDSGDAMRFAQAALNGANALCALRNAAKEG